MKKALLSGVALAAGLALALPLVASGAPKGKNPPNANPDLSITANVNPVLWGRAITISGKLRGADNTGKTVTLEQNPYPFDDNQFRRVGTATTDAQGDYSFTGIKPGEHTKYHVVVKRQPEPDIVSGDYLEYVRMRVTRRVDDTTPQRGQTVTFTGTVKPPHDGMVVRIQRRRPTGTWRTMANAPLTDAGTTNPDASVYTASVKIYRDGVWRAKVRGDADHFGNKSRRIRLDVP